MRWRGGIDGNDNDIVAYTRAIQEAVESGELELQDNYRQWKDASFRGPFIDLKATRKKLIEYCKNKGLKPPILFPEERK